MQSDFSSSPYPVPSSNVKTSICLCPFRNSQCIKLNFRHFPLYGLSQCSASMFQFCTFILTLLCDSYSFSWMALTGWNHSYHLGHSHFLFAKFQVVCIVSECFETVYLIQMNKILESLNTRLLQKWNKGEAESVTLITILFPHCRSIKEGLRIECAPFPSRELLP